jgi:lipoate-protein ligase A
LVEHNGDWTWSLVAPDTGASSATIYRVLHEAVAEVLRGAGHAVRLATPSDERAGAICFSAPVGCDIVCDDGRKVCGGALRRGRAALLYQGSIQGISLPAGFLSSVAGRLSPDVTPGSVRFDDEAALLADEKYRSDAWNRRR